MRGLPLFGLALCVTVVRTEVEYDRLKQIVFVEARETDMPCWHDGVDATSANVWVLGNKTSVDGCLELSNAQRARKWPITWRNVMGLSLAMKTVLACQYGKSAYSFVRYLTAYLRLCRDRGENSRRSTDTGTTGRDECVEKSRLELKTFSENISKMMFTLVSFDENLKHSANERQDVIKILVSLYLSLKAYVHMTFPKTSASGRDTNDEEHENVVNDYVNTLQVIAVQIEISVEEFVINNCLQSPKEFTIFAKSFDHLGTATAAEVFESLTKTSSDLAKYIFSEHVHGNVINTDKGYEEQLLGTLKENVRKQFKWNEDEWLPVHEIFEKHVRNTRVTENVVRYENLMLRLMAELVLGKVVCELERSLAKTGNGDATNQRSSHYVVETMSKFISNIHSLKAPKIFVNYMIELHYRVDSIVTCFWTDSPDRGRTLFDQLKLENKIRFDYGVPWKMVARDGDNTTATGPAEIVALHDFFNLFILKNINNTFLNREIIGLLCDKSSVVMSQPFEFAVDFKNVHLEWAKFTSDNRDAFESVKKSTRDAAREALAKIVGCYDIVRSLKSPEHFGDGGASAADRVKSCFVEYNRALLTLKNAVRRLFLTVHGEKYRSEDYFGKLLLTLYYNSENVDLFDESAQLFVDDGRVQNLVTFHTVFVDSLAKYDALACVGASHTPGSTRDGADKISTTKRNAQLGDYLHDFYGDDKPASSSLGKTVHTTDGFGRYFRAVKTYTEFVAANVEAFHGARIRFHWHNRRVSVRDVQKELRKNTFDLQGLVEYQYTTVKWIVCALYSILLNILNAMINYRVPSADFRVTCFLEELQYLLTLRFHDFTPRPVNLVFSEFSNIIRNDAATVEAKRKLKNLVVDELMMYGVVMSSLPNAVGKDIATYMSQVCKDIESLKRTGFSSLLDAIGLKSVLGPKTPITTENNENRIDIRW